jgi:hypothetical protein
LRYSIAKWSNGKQLEEGRELERKRVVEGEDESNKSEEERKRR